MTFSDDFIISSKVELIELINKVGFVPFFENEIEGFSPVESYRRVFGQLKKILPAAEDAEIERILK